MFFGSQREKMSIEASRCVREIPPILDQVHSTFNRYFPQWIHLNRYAASLYFEWREVANNDVTTKPSQGYWNYIDLVSLDNCIGHNEFGTPTTTLINGRRTRQLLGKLLLRQLPVDRRLRIGHRFLATVFWNRIRPCLTTDSVFWFSDQSDGQSVENHSTGHYARYRVPQIVRRFIFRRRRCEEIRVNRYCFRFFNPISNTLSLLSVRVLWDNRFAPLWWIIHWHRLSSSRGWVP